MDFAPVEDQVFGIFFDRGAEAAFTMRLDDRVILSANRHFENLVGQPARSFVGSSASQLFAQDDQDEHWDDWIVTRAGLHEDVRLCRFDGVPVFVSLTVAHLRQGGEPLIACIARDTTERRNLERDLMAKHTALHAAHAELSRTVEQLRHAQASLEDRNHELAALGSQFALASQRAAIGEFSAGIAHSINNPMAALSSALGQISKRLERNAEPALRNELSRFLDRSTNAIGRMETIVDAVRRAHKSGSLPSTAQAVNIADELRTALLLFEQRMGKIQLILEFEDSPMAWIPPDALHHVVSNLFDNALQALNGSGQIRLHLHRTEEGVILDIEDNGPGLPDAVLEKLFEPFVSGRSNGTGLGLSMSLGLARRWRGDISHHTLENGTRFRILMPAHNNHQDNAPTEHSHQEIDRHE